MTSFWKSTKCLALPWPTRSSTAPARAAAIGCSARSPRRRDRRNVAVADGPPPRRLRRRQRPSARQPASVKVPLQAPADRSACIDVSGTKHGQRVVVAQLAAGLAEQVHGRVPAAGHRRRDRRRSIAAPMTRPRPAVERHDIDAGDPLAAVRRRDGEPVGSISTPLGARCRQRAVGCGAQIDDGGDVDAALGQVERGLIGAVVVGERRRRACPGSTP